jgi:hypothetical protein
MSLRAASLIAVMLLTGCGDMPPHPCEGKLREGWVRHIPTGEYRRFEVYNFMDAEVRSTGRPVQIYPPVCAEYERVSFE